MRGAGLIWGLELTRDAAAVVPAALERGVIVNRTAERVVRLLPPLVITEAEPTRRSTGWTRRLERSPTREDNRDDPTSRLSAQRDADRTRGGCTRSSRQP